MDGQTNIKSFGFTSPSNENPTLLFKDLPGRRNNFLSSLSSTPQDSPLIRVTAKPIKNPFLQALFNRQSIQVAKEQIETIKQQPRISPQRQKQKSLHQLELSPTFQREQDKNLQTALPKSHQPEKGSQRQNFPFKSSGQPTKINDDKTKLPAKSLREEILQQKKAQNEEISKILEETQKELIREKDLEKKN